MKKRSVSKKKEMKFLYDCIYNIVFFFLSTVLLFGHTDGHFSWMDTHSYIDLVML